MAETVNASMDDGSDLDNKKLEVLFHSGWTMYDELDKSTLHSNSTEFKNKVRQVMDYFERSTRIVSEVGLFSPNELIDEVSTESLQYMLLPYFLGKLSLKIHDPDNIEVLNVAEIYFKDHLQRCAEYSLHDELKKLQIADNQGNLNELEQLTRAALSRNEKIAQYNKMKELDEYINKFKESVKNKVIDDEIKREYFLKFIEKSIIDAKQELQSLSGLKEMVKIRNSRISGGESMGYPADNGAILDSNEPGHSAKSLNHGGHIHHHHSHQPGKPKPLQPFIITRNAAQKTVFGLGYPSLPVMTVDEFYQNRVDEGIFPDEQKVAKMNQAQAIAAAQDPNEKEDQEKAIEELQAEDDDPEYIARMRRMDEYKDVVRRGDGNRHNRS